MKPINFITRRCVGVLAVALLSASGLAGCGSDNDGYDMAAVPAPTPVPVPVPAIDAFYAAVAALAVGSPDDSESGIIDTAAITTPEDTEPQPLG